MTQIRWGEKWVHLAYIWIVCHLSAKNYQNRWKFDAVLTKTNLLSFFETRCSLMALMTGASRWRDQRNRPFESAVSLGMPWSIADKRSTNHHCSDSQSSQLRATRPYPLQSSSATYIHFMIDSARPGVSSPPTQSAPVLSPSDSRDRSDKQVPSWVIASVEI